jgi:hypothetical protein
MTIVIDKKSLVRTIAALYITYAAWGATSVLFGISTVELISGSGGQAYWTLAVTAVATFLAYAVIKDRRMLEIILSFVFTSLVAVLALFYAILAFSGDWNRIPPIILTLSYMVIPIWRIRYLTRKSKVHG